tara:strand:+ start:5961 stop:6707 length:747 start_codon:yes stop_codon:yes gene_type:complete
MSKNISSKKIYAVVISYKSSPVLGDLYKRINKDNFDKIYFFDDNSPDNSAEEAKKYDWIVVKNEKNLGHGGNLKKALKTIFEDGADYGVEIHADNQYSPNEVEKAKDMILDDYDLIIGSRFKNKNPFLKDGMPFLRYFTNKIMSFVTSKLFKINLTEFHTGCKIFSKKFCNSVPIYENSDDYLFSFQVIMQASFYKKKYGEISITSSYEGYKTSCNYLNGFIYLFGNFKIMLVFLLVKLKLIKSKTFK